MRSSSPRRRSRRSKAGYAAFPTCTPESERDSSRRRSARTRASCSSCSRRVMRSCEPSGVCWSFAPAKGWFARTRASTESNPPGGGHGVPASGGPRCLGTPPSCRARRPSSASDGRARVRQLRPRLAPGSVGRGDRLCRHHADRGSPWHPRCARPRADRHHHAVADAIAAAASLMRAKAAGDAVVVVRGLESCVTEDDGPGAAAVQRPEQEDLFT